jgi:hypothetical protein
MMASRRAPVAAPADRSPLASSPAGATVREVPTARHLVGIGRGRDVQVLEQRARGNPFAETAARDGGMDDGSCASVARDDRAGDAQLGNMGRRWLKPRCATSLKCCGRALLHERAAAHFFRRRAIKIPRQTAGIAGRLG